MMKEKYSVPTILDFNAAEKTEDILVNLALSLMTRIKVSTGRPLMKAPPYIEKKAGISRLNFNLKI